MSRYDNNANPTAIGDIELNRTNLRLKPEQFFCGAVFGIILISRLLPIKMRNDHLDGNGPKAAAEAF